jgi:glutathione S-transferase
MLASSNHRWTRAPAADSVHVVLRVHRIPFSTNVERVALAAAHKGLTIEWVDHDAGDRSAIRALSGQELVPVLETANGLVLTDSPQILRWLEREYPDPPLWPDDPALRARVDVLIEWFNGVWKGPPNWLADDPGNPAASAWATRLTAWTDTVEGLLSGAGYLVGDTLTAADVVAFPFLQIGATPADPDDADPFHAVLRRHCALGPQHAATRAWIARMAALPQA